MRVLFICTQAPEPAHGGAALRAGGWLRATSTFAEVGLVALTRSDREEEAVHRAAKKHGWWLRTVQAPRTAGSRLRDLLLSGLGSTPYLLLAAREQRLQEAVRESLADFRPHIVQAELLPAAQYLEQPRSAGLPTVYSAHNVESRIAAGVIGARGRPWQHLVARRLDRHEKHQARQADAVVVVSEQEAEWFQRIAHKVTLVPNALELDRYPFQHPADQPRSDLLFTGHLSYPPNRDAAQLLARKVLPLVAREWPQMRCRIAGAHPSTDVRSLAGSHIDVIANFADFESLSRQSAVFVSPLRWGAGSRLKLLEAAAVGLPIVATPLSAEGLSLEPGRDFLAGSSPEELAAAVLTLLRDLARRKALAQTARSTVESFHDWSHQRETIEALYAGLLDHPGSR